MVCRHLTSDLSSLDGGGSSSGLVFFCSSWYLLARRERRPAACFLAFRLSSGPCKYMQRALHTSPGVTSVRYSCIMWASQDWFFFFLFTHDGGKDGIKIHQSVKWKCFYCPAEIESFLHVFCFFLTLVKMDACSSVRDTVCWFYISEINSLFQPIYLSSGWY